MSPKKRHIHSTFFKEKNKFYFFCFMSLEENLSPQAQTLFLLQGQFEKYFVLKPHMKFAMFVDGVVYYYNNKKKLSATEVITAAKKMV